MHMWNHQQCNDRLLMPAGLHDANWVEPASPDMCCLLPACSKAMLQGVVFQPEHDVQQADHMSIDRNACRKAIMQAGMAQPGMIYAGLTSLMDYMNAKDKETFNSTLQKGMSMLEQVDSAFR